jgi:hypothetical protein
MYWAIVYFVWLIENCRMIAYFWATFFHGAKYELILAKNGLGCILGDSLQTHLITQYLVECTYKADLQNSSKHFFNYIHLFVFKLNEAGRVARYLFLDKIY